MTCKKGTSGLGEPVLDIVTEKTPLIQPNDLKLSPHFRDHTTVLPGLRAYSNALDKNPVAVKALTSLVGWLLGDLIAQVSLNMKQLHYYI